jgi:hypothetical protein
MPDSSDYWVVLERDEIEIHLVPQDWPGGALIRVDDVDIVAEELSTLGATFESGPTSQEYHMRDFAVSDPNNNQIGFWQPA